mmetsp:Transcript_33791/g.78509  ORF Transcript_33791/g.78509 Transcript_33791/m.78509 type:complete len:869 (+) Transcript_33791:48-2654(+)
MERTQPSDKPGTVMELLVQVGLAHQQELQAVKDDVLAESAALQVEIEELRILASSSRSPQNALRVHAAPKMRGRVKSTGPPGDDGRQAWGGEETSVDAIDRFVIDAKVESMESLNDEVQGSAGGQGQLFPPAVSSRGGSKAPSDAGAMEHASSGQSSTPDSHQRSQKTAERGSLLKVREDEDGKADANIPELCDVWKAGRRVGKARVNLLASRSRHTRNRPDVLQAASPRPLEDFFEEGPGRCVSRLVVAPTSLKRLSYDVFGVLLICYDLIFLPIEAFQPESSLFMEIMAWVSSCYWLLDIPLSFLVGYPLLEEGTVEMKVPKIAANYLRTWFVFDFAVVCLDWALHIWSLAFAADSDSGADAGVAFFRTAKTIRLLRFFRLIRLMKARSRINDFVERVQSEASLILIGIAKLIAFIALINHLVACIWYAIGTYDLTREDTWLRTTGLDAKNIWYRYSTALHWSMSQFTPASMEVVPANEYERFFTVCMILCGMLIFSSFVSAITSAMNQLRNLNSWRHEQESLLRRYLQENEVSPSLTARIHNCLQKALQRSRRRVHVDEIRIFQQLPLSLKFELTSEIYSPTLGRHPFFNFCHSCLPSESRKIYSNGVSQKYLVMSQELLTTGEAGKHMYFLQTGTLNYKQENEPEYRTKAEQLWLVEAALWLKWIHVGTAESLTHCELLGLDVGKVQDVLKDEATVATYARKFWKYFSENPGLLSDVWMGDPDDDESPHHWAASAFSRAEEIMGRSIQPEPLSPVFTRFLDRLRRASNGMLRRFSVASIDVDDAGPAVAGPGKLPPQLQALVDRMQLQRQEEAASDSDSESGLGDNSEEEAPPPPVAKTNRNASICAVVPAPPAPPNSIPSPTR